MPRVTRPSWLATHAVLRCACCALRGLTCMHVAPCCAVHAVLRALLGVAVQHVGTCIAVALLAVSSSSRAAAVLRTAVLCLLSPPAACLALPAPRLPLPSCCALPGRLYHDSICVQCSAPALRAAHATDRVELPQPPPLKIQQTCECLAVKRAWEGAVHKCVQLRMDG